MIKNRTLCTTIYKRYSLSFPVPNDGLGVEWSLLLGVHYTQHIWCTLYYYNIIIHAETQIIFLSTDGTYKIFLSDMFQITARSFVHSSTQCILLSARYAFRSVPVRRIPSPDVCRPLRFSFSTYIFTRAVLKYNNIFYSPAPFVVCRDLAKRKIYLPR